MKKTWAVITYFFIYSWFSQFFWSIASVGGRYLSGSKKSWSQKSPRNPLWQKASHGGTWVMLLVGPTLQAVPVYKAIGTHSLHCSLFHLLQTNCQMNSEDNIAATQTGLLCAYFKHQQPSKSASLRLSPIFAAVDWAWSADRFIAR